MISRKSKIDNNEVKNGEVLKNGKYGIDHNTTILVIDVQEKLVPVMQPDRARKMLSNIGILVQLAEDLEVPVLYSEQYPKGLGATVAPLRDWLSSKKRIEKTCFDLCEVEGIDTKSFNSTLIVCGIEAHICVLSTVLTLLELGFRVCVPLDAVASRTKDNYRNALSLMGKAGAEIVNTETIVFQSLKDSRSDHFKKYSKLIL